MNRHHMLTISLMTGIGIVGAAAITYGLNAAHSRYSHLGCHGGHRSMAHLCQGDTNNKLNQMSGYLESELKLTADQRQKWDAVTQVVKNSDLKSPCPASAKNTDSAPATLIQLETTLSKGLSTVQQVRQPFNTFYTSLAASQQQSLNNLLSYCHHR